MKFVLSDNTTIVFLNKNHIKTNEFIEDMENNLKTILLKIRNKFNINIYGFYLVDVYVDKNYGIILEFNKENDDFLFFEDSIEMKIKFIETNFKYKVNNINIMDSSILEKGKLDKVGSDFYFFPAELNNVEYGKLFEFTDVTYGKEVI